MPHELIALFMLYVTTPWGCFPKLQPPEVVNSTTNSNVYLLLFRIYTLRSKD